MGLHSLRSAVLQLQPRSSEAKILKPQEGPLEPELQDCYSRAPSLVQRLGKNLLTLLESSKYLLSSKFYRLIAKKHLYKPKDFWNSVLWSYELEQVEPFWRQGSGISQSQQSNMVVVVNRFGFGEGMTEPCSLPIWKPTERLGPDGSPPQTHLSATCSLGSWWPSG